MYPYILCYCGRPLADIVELFNALRLKAIKAEKGTKDIAPDRLPMAEVNQASLNDIFKALHIELDCCRARLMTQADYTEYY